MRNDVFPFCSPVIWYAGLLDELVELCEGVGMVARGPASWQRGHAVPARRLPRRRVHLRRAQCYAEDVFMVTILLLNFHENYYPRVKKSVKTKFQIFHTLLVTEKFNDSKISKSMG